MQLHVQADGMIPKNLVRGLIVVLLLTNCFATITQFEKEPVKAEVLPKFYVDDDYDSDTPGWQVDHFNIIQEAIDNATSGDRILVYNGNYVENLRINSSKTNLDLFGEDKDYTILTGSSSSNKDVIWINAAGVDISSFSIKRSGSLTNNSVIKINAGSCTVTDCAISLGKNGILISNCSSNKVYYNTITGYSSNRGQGVYLNNSNSNTITYNTITANNNGIFGYNSSSNTIQNNTIKSNVQNGIFLNETCNSTTISHNNISLNTLNGIFFNDHCGGNTLYRNEIHGNSNSGIRLENSSSNTIHNSTCNTNTDYGIMIVGSSNTIRHCDVNLNSKHGIFLFADNNNNVLNNVLQDNTLDGIRLHNSTSDNITRNGIIGNSRYGAYLNYYSVDNLIYNNIFKQNANNNALDMSENNNNWKRTSTSGTNIINGSTISGNYWDDFDEISEGALDATGNGIADSARTINISSSDSGSLVDTNTPSIGTPSISPSYQAVGSNTNISITASDGETPLTVVNIVMTDPNGQTSNFSILANKTYYNNIYFCNKAYSTIGNYSFYVAARDTRNWVSSSSGSFYIHKGTPPTVTDNTPTSGSPSTSFTFNVTVTSGATSASNMSVFVNWTHNDYSGNNTMTNTGGNYFAKTVTLDNSINSLTYFIFAKDQWNNNVTTSTKTVTITDSTEPTITVTRYGSSFEDLPNSFTYQATVTDNCELEEVYIEYWYGDLDKMTADMENNAGSTYKKVITPQGSPDQVFCVIYAKDTSGNIADTKNPHANAGGPYTGYVTNAIRFNGSESYDLDGNISSYSWDFGDGTTGDTENPVHNYSTNGTYTVTLTVTDVDGNTGSDTATVTVSIFTQQKASASTITTLQSRYSIVLSSVFFAYDSDGDGVADAFVDPNGVLEVEHTGNISINGHVGFLLSVNNNLNKLFIWDTQTDSITNVTYKEGTVLSDSTDEDAGVTTVTVNVSKSNWIYMAVNDPHTGSSLLTVKKSDGTNIPTDMYWRKNSKIYVVDDADTTYIFEYTYTPPAVEISIPMFSPSSGGFINQDNPTITITYEVPVTLDVAWFYLADQITLVPIDQDNYYFDITNEVITLDDMTFTYTPPSDLPEGAYVVEFTVKTQVNPLEQSTDYASYEYQPYAMAKIMPYIIMIAGCIGVSVAFYLFLRWKNITFESFIYVKSRRILPFFKPVIFGPLRIDVNDEKESKAEFYVNGSLKDTITEAPYIWYFRDKAYLKHNIETKVYDDQGNVSSSGEMTFYIINPFKPKNIDETNSIDINSEQPSSEQE